MKMIALGAGVQSTALYLMSATGVLERADVAIFADTGGEPDYVYRHLDYLERLDLGIPIHRASAGDLLADALRSRDGRTRWSTIPFFVEGASGRGVPLRRFCTRDYKILPIRRKLRELGAKQAEEWLGISIDEADRMKRSDVQWVTTRWPLVERGLTRQACINWIDRSGFRVPGRSACVFCPYHSDDYWRALKREHPRDFEKAVEIDREIRRGELKGVAGVPYLHASLRPLDEIEFDAQPSLFAEECRGVCGV